MYSYSIEEARKIVLKCAKDYNKHLVGKRFLIIYRHRTDNAVRFFEIHFGKENFQHLTGVELVDENGTVREHVADKLVGNVNFCLGLVLDKDNDYYVPASSLLEDIKKLTNKPSQVLAIFSKDNSEDVYRKIRHVAKGLNLKNLKMPKEVLELISLDDYVSKD